MSFSSAFSVQQNLLQTVDVPELSFHPLCFPFIFFLHKTNQSSLSVFMHNVHICAFLCMLLRSSQPLFVRGDKCYRESDTVAERSWEGEGVETEIKKNPERCPYREMETAYKTEKKSISEKKKKNL